MIESLNSDHQHNGDKLLSFFLGKNTPERQDFIVGSPKIEKDLVEG